jgi:DnaJ-domain-containing protein 1
MKGRLGARVHDALPFLSKLWERRAAWQGKAIGLVVGLVAGWYGLIVGFIVGYLTDELLKQGRSDRALIRYLEAPGPVPFEEPAPGVAAFCALATLIAASVSERRVLRASSASEGIGIADRIARSAAEAFGLERKTLPTLESFVRVASLRLDRLNPDLLAESLVSRRRRSCDADALVSSLAEFASSRGASDLVARIRTVVGPSRTGNGAAAGASTALAGEDPWELLGVSKGSSIDEVKTAFRRLAVDVHPDSAGSTDEEEKRKASEAFMRLEAAYREILRAAPQGDA